MSKLDTILDARVIEVDNRRNVLHQSMIEQLKEYVQKELSGDFLTAIGEIEYSIVNSAPLGSFESFGQTFSFCFSNDLDKMIDLFIGGVSKTSTGMSKGSLENALLDLLIGIREVS